MSPATLVTKTNLIHCSYNHDPSIISFMVEPPTITEATILEREVDTKYVCRATGIPVPTITWRAINVTTNERRTLVDNDNGITIVKVTMMEEAFSELFLIHGLNFERISCVAENAVERVALFENEFDDLGGNDMTHNYN